MIDGHFSSLRTLTFAQLAGPIILTTAQTLFKIQHMNGPRSRDAFLNLQRNKTLAEK
jgi:hypothetical protein